MPMTSKKMVKFLCENGFEEIRQHGLHEFFNRKTGKTITVLIHCRDIPHLLRGMCLPLKRTRIKGS